MFLVGDYIICGKNGVCIVEKIGPMDMAGVSSDKLYYTLAPVYSSSSRIFTPVDNDKIVMRRIMTKDEANELIEMMPVVEELVVSDEKRRENLYKEIIMSCDGKQLVSIIKMLYTRKKNCIANGKKVHSVDERYLKIAQDYLYGELACSLDIDRNKVVEAIENRLCEK